MKNSLQGLNSLDVILTLCFIQVVGVCECATLAPADLHSLGFPPLLQQRERNLPTFKLAYYMLLIAKFCQWCN